MLRSGNILKFETPSFLKLKLNTNSKICHLLCQKLVIKLCIHLAEFDSPQPSRYTRSLLERPQKLVLGHGFGEHAESSLGSSSLTL